MRIIQQNCKITVINIHIVFVIYQLINIGFHFVSFHYFIFIYVNNIRSTDKMATGNLAVV